MVLSIYLDFIEEKKYYVDELTWTNLESLAAKKLEIKESVINKICRDAFDEWLLLIKKKKNSVSLQCQNHKNHKSIVLQSVQPTVSTEWGDGTDNYWRSHPTTHEMKDSNKPTNAEIFV